ncbi:plexin-A1-like [Rhopalosiphum padi]|uniref:plexin-A1-like n=1 Tax=Rhopalosiphum padi TaxID=40932 RepID=UPI00298E0BE8|nr:plexin-A1-like [Rhopalosiphum padi]
MIFSNFIIFMVSLRAVAHTRASEPAKNGTVNCEEYVSCTKCVNETLCSWSLERQNCAHPEELSENLMVHVEADCPQFAVAKQPWVKDVPYSYTLTVSNDKKDFVAFLRRSTITCSLHTVNVRGRVDQNDIKCDAIKRTQTDFAQHRQTIYFYYVRLNNNTLRLDNEADYYVPNYDRECGPKRDDSCVTCTWTADGYVNHFKRCSSANRCTGLYQFSDRRHALKFTDAPAAVTAMAGRCVNATVASAVPVTAPWTGGTAVLVTVKNHRILAEKKTVTVTVAGRSCVDPRTVDNETIACTVARPAAGEAPAADGRPTVGLVGVEYGPRQRYAVASQFPFKLVEPRLTDVSPTCGPLSGGTTLDIGGEHLDTGNGVSVTIGGSAACAVTDRRWDRISCVTGAGVVINDTVNVAFDNGTAIRQVGRKYFAYTADPVLDAATSPLAGIASGGTAVPVRGRHFSCARNTTMTVHVRNGTVRRTGCQVYNDTFMVCRSPTLLPDDIVPAVQPQRPTTAAAAAGWYEYIEHDDDDDDTANIPIGAFRCDFRVVYNGTAAGAAFLLTAEYRVYADPVLRDFETDGHAITVFGRNLQDWAGDVAVELLRGDDSPAANPCDVTSAGRRRIVCVPRNSSIDLDAVRALNITVGLSFGRVVHRRPPVRPDDEYVWQRPWTDGRTAVAVLAALSSLLCGGCVALLCRRKITNRYTHSVTRTPLFELHPPADRNDSIMIM